MRPTVYLAGPITGLTYDEGQDWRDHAAQELEEFGIMAYSPLRGQDCLRSAGVLHNGPYADLDPTLTMKAIVARDYRDCTTCDLVIANLLNTTKPSLGTVMEIAWAYAARVPCVVVMDEGNVHDHGMIRECASHRVRWMDDAIYVARRVLLP